MPAIVRRKTNAMRVVFIIAGCLLLSLMTGAQPYNAAPPAGRNILTGADQMNEYLPLLKGKSVAVFANATSMVGQSHLVDTLLKRGINIRRIFSPEHGFRGDADAGEQVASQTDPATGIPIVSLYGSKRQPSAEDLTDVDLLLFDIQDVGVRFYTYISSLQRYLEAAILNHRPLIILDRPDPNGSYVDGPILDPKYKSFVGMQPIPIVYGMTIGEYARMLIGEQWLDSSVSHGSPATPQPYAAPQSSAAAGSSARQQSSAPSGSSATQPSFLSMRITIAKPGSPVDIQSGEFQLIIIPCSKYTHKSIYTLPVRPSPNLPNMQAVYLYPSLCLFEGTAISLGRGTSLPFQQWGHPAFPKKLYSFTPRSVAGAKTPPLLDQLCYGYDLSQIDVAKTTGNRWSLKWLLQAYAMFPDKEHFFNGTGSGFDRLAGGNTLRNQIVAGKSEKEIRASWEPALSQFKKIRKKYLLYAD